MRALCIAYIKQHRYFSDKFLQALADSSLLKLYVEVVNEQGS